MSYKLPRNIIRQAKPEKVAFSVYMEKDLQQLCDRVAADSGISRNALISLAVEKLIVEAVERAEEKEAGGYAARAMRNMPKFRY